MHHFEDNPNFHLVLDITVPWAHTWADMRKGKTDRERREAYRQAAAEKLLALPGGIDWWGFSIFVRKSGRLLDIDNVPKPIIDSFCARQIAQDESTYENLGLFPDDSLRWVRAVNVQGEPANEDSTTIRIFAYAPDAKGA